MQTNPNGVPTLGNQYLLGIQVAGIATPTFLGSNLISFTGALKNTTTTASGTFYTPTEVLFQSESDTATSGDASYARKDDSYFASPWQTLLASPNGAGETSTSLYVNGGTYGVVPAYVPSNGIYPFAYVDVTSATGVSITGTLAIGTTPAPIGNGGGLRLTLDGQLVNLAQVNGDYNGNGVVDAADYVVWSKKLGQSYTLAGEEPGAATPGFVDMEDYVYWRSQFGATTGGGATVGALPGTVPEPSSIGLLAIAIWCNHGCRYGGWQGAFSNS
jgi:hypothetical protein